LLQKRHFSHANTAVLKIELGLAACCAEVKLTGKTVHHLFVFTALFVDVYFIKRKDFFAILAFFTAFVTFQCVLLHSTKWKLFITSIV
jgi:hypothetical protein